MIVAMNDIYEEATLGFEVDEAVARRIRGLISDARNLRVAQFKQVVFVEAMPQPPCRARKVLGRFTSVLEAQNFMWAYLTGVWGVVKDIRFIRINPNIYVVDFGALIRDIRAYLTGRSK